MSKSKGTRGEKKVVSWFEDHGWYSQRTGGSGAGTSDDRPDTVAMRPNNRGSTDCVVTEVKARNDGKVRFDKEEIEQLESVAERSGALALYITKPDLRKHDHMYAFTKDDLKENAKSYTVTGKMVEKAESIEEKIQGYFR